MNLCETCEHFYVGFCLEAHGFHETVEWGTCNKYTQQVEYAELLNEYNGMRAR